MKKNLEFAGLTDTGRVRKANEDNWFGDASQGLFIVSDGMGGHAAGEVASKIVVETLPSLVSQWMGGVNDLTDRIASANLSEAISYLSTKVWEESNSRPGLAGMGATVVMALYHGAHALIGHLGDSRAYLFRDGELSLLTRDHSIVQILIDAGEISDEEALHHPARGTITRAVGMNIDVIPDTQILDLEPDDVLLLCCDGLNDMIGDDLIAWCLEQSTDLKDSCRRLVHEANAAGGRDNITVVLVRWLGPG